MNVLSLFDGMSCGQIALQRAGIKVDKYYAAEIDKYAIKVTQANYPNTIQLGSAIDIKAVGLEKIDLVIGGSPCQGFSFAGKGLNFEDPRSKLFFEYVRLWKEVKAINPDAKFLLENVRMKYEHELVISKYMGVEPIEINSALVSAQNRVRLYWTNINEKPFGMFGDMKPDITQPKDKGIFLKDILQESVDNKYSISETALKRILKGSFSKAKFNPEKTGTINTKNNSGQLSVDSGTTLITDNAIGRSVQIESVDKSPPLRSHDGCAHDNKIIYQSSHGFNKGGFHEEKSATLIGNSFTHNNHIVERKVIQVNPNIESGGKQPYQQNRIYDSEGIMSCLSAGSHGNAQHLTKIFHNKSVRRLTEVECERLQTVPDNYTNHVSSTQRYRMLGNGWTVDVVAHIFTFLTPTPNK